uniref:Death inducer-obliterator 1 n=1 Tax=Stegastes partitus TaxID=144197 RepID=A0A3B5A685_9TELE
MDCCKKEMSVLFSNSVCFCLSTEEQQSQSEDAESSVRPTLSQVRKSWGFRRTTIARREFMDEVGDLSHSPPLVRRGRGRRTYQTPQTTTETPSTERPAQTARSVIEDLQWSAPSSPVSEDSKPASEASAGGSLDPSLWQDFGSAFHTAFSLLGGDEGLSMTMSDALAVPDILEATDAIKIPNPQTIEETEVFMICCDSCQEWFHGDCVGISETEGRKIERKGQEYTCPPCTVKKQSQLQSESHPQPEPEYTSLFFGLKMRICSQESVLMGDEEEKEEQIPITKPEPEAEMETDSSFPLCIGPSCSKQALPDSVYCGTDCILQHAAFTMKTLSGPKVPKPKGRPPKKAAPARPAAKVSIQTERRSFSIFTQSSLLFFILTANDDSKKEEADSEASSNQCPEEPSTDVALLSQPAPEADPPQSDSQEKAKERVNSSLPKHESEESDPPIPHTSAKSSLSPTTESPTTSAPRHHETGALMVTKTAYVIPKKQSGSQSPSSHVPATTSCQKPSSAPMLLNETRNLPVSPAPSAPSSRPSQPNTQVRQSIQRSLSSILFKRVCDCEDLEMSESEVAKLVASIEMEMFDIFRNTDSKYMNKYRTIMFNLKDPRNKGLLYRVVHGEIGPFRLVRMTQKDMQATKAPEPKAKETTELCLVCVVLVCVASQEQKRSLPAPSVKARANQPSQISAVPDILACMLKDTTSEHKTHLFDLKCKICTGDDSPLRAPPDSPDMDSPISSLMEPSSHFTIDPPPLTIVESPASPVMDSPASPTLESPASPVMESPASPTPDTPKAATQKREYTPVVIPAVSTVTITRRDPRTAASRFSASSSSASRSSSTTHNEGAPYAPIKEATASHSAQAPSLPPTITLPKSILMKPSSTSPVDGQTTQFLAKQDILWKGFLNMLSVAKFVTKAYLVSGSAENLKADLPDTIQIGGRIMPETVWDYVTKIKTSVTKELCVIRFQPATEEEEVAYVSLFSYFSSRGRFGVVANSSNSIKDVYLVPLSSKESIPSILQPLEGPGLEKKRPNLLLGLAIVQRTKRPGCLPQETEEKRPRVHMSRDPMWIPKPPVLYGSDKLEIFQPYDPETPTNTTPPASPSCPGSPSDSSSSGSVIIPSVLTSVRATPPVSTSATFAATQPTSNSISDKDLSTASSNKTPLQTILKTLFGNKQSDSTVSSDGSSAKTTASAKKMAVLSQVSGSMVDPIVQQYGQKSKIKEIEVEDNEFDRPYDPEEEYDPAGAYKTVAPQTKKKNKADGPALSGIVEDDVAYDPEDETIFEDIQSGIAVKKPPVPTQTLDSPSSATLSEQQRMLEELNKQIEEQKRQLKEQEEALRQQREAVGMFMAHFSVSDSLTSPPSKSLPLNQLSSLHSSTIQTESKPSDPTDSTVNLTETVDNSNVDSQTVKLVDTTEVHDFKNDTENVAEQDDTQENVEECDKYSSAGEIEDSDVAYDPEDESLFNEIQEDVFKGASIKSSDSLSRAGHSGGHKGTSPNSHSRKRRSSPKRRSRRERDHHRSPSRKSQRRSPSHSRRRRDRDRHRRSERDRSRHRVRDPSERHGRHRKDHNMRRHSRGHRRSSSSPQKKDSVSLSPKQHRGPFPEVLEKSKHALDSVAELFAEGNTSSSLVTIKKEPVESPDKDLASCLHVKLETSEPPKFQELQKNSTVSGSSAPVDKPSQQETLYNSKFESTVPLREIDPPIRDSPQSPDPEPQFLKPNSIEKNDFVKTEEIRDPQEHTIVQMQFGNAENNCLHIGSQVTMSNNLSPTVGEPVSNVRNLLFRDVGLKVPGLRHPEMMSQGGGHPSSATRSDIQSTSGPGISNPRPDLKEIGGQAKHVKEPGISVPGLEPNIRDSCIQHRNPHVGELGIQNERANPVMHGHLSGKLVPDHGGSRLRDCVSAVYNLNTDSRTPVIVEERSQNVSCPERSLLCLKTEENRSQPENPDGKADAIKIGIEQPCGGPQLEGRAPDIGEMGQKDGDESRHSKALRSDMMGVYLRDSSPSLMGSRGVQRQSRNDGSPALEERGSQKRAFQPRERDVDLSRVTDVHEWSFDSSTSIGSEGKLLMADRLSAITDEKQGAQRGVHVRGPGLNLNCKNGEPNMSFIGQEVPQQDVGAQRSVHGPDTRKSETMHEIRTPDMTGRNHKEPSQDIYGMGRSDARGDRRSSSSASGETGHNRRNADMQEGNTQSQWPDRRNEQKGPENRDWRGIVGPDIKGQRNQNKDLGPHMRDPHWKGPGSDIRDNWRAHQSDRQGLDKESQGPEKRGVGGLGLRQPGPEMREPHMQDLRQDSRGPRGPDFIGPGPERRGPDMEVPVHDRRGLGGSDFMRQGHERRGPDIEVPIHDRREHRGPDFKGSERKGPTMNNQKPGLRVPGGPHFLGPRLENRGVAEEGHGLDRRGPVGPHFRGSGPEGKGPAIESQGPDVRGPAGADFRGPWPEKRGPDMVGTGPDRRGQGDPDFRGPGFERRGPPMEVSGTDRRGHGPGFRGLAPESRGLFMEASGPEKRGPGGPDFHDPGPDSRAPALGGPRPDRRVLGGPDFSGSGCELRGPSIDGQEPDRRRPIVPDFWGPGSDRRSLPTDGLGPERRGPTIEGPRTDRREPGGPDFRGPVPESRELPVVGPGPHGRGQGRPHCRDRGSEIGHPNMEGPGLDRRGPDFRGPWLERPGSGMETSGLNRRGPGGPKMGRPVFQHAGPNTDGPGPDQRLMEGPNFRESGPERRPLDMESPQTDRRGPHFRGVGSDATVMRGQWRTTTGPRGFVGPGCEGRGLDIEGPGHDRQEPAGSSFREPGPEGRHIEGPGPDWRISGDPNFPCSNIEDKRHEIRDDWGGSDPIQESPGLVVPRFDRPGQNFRGPRPMRRNIRRPGPDLDQGYATDRSGTGTEEQWSDGRGPNMEALGIEIGFSEDDWERDSHWRAGPIQECSDEQGQEHSRQGPRSEWRGRGRRGPGLVRERPNVYPEDEWNGPGCRRPGPVQDNQDMGCPGPSRGGHGHKWREPDRGGAGPFFRGERESHNRETGSDMQGHPDMENDWRQPDFRGRMRVSNMERPEAYRRGPGGPHLRPPGPGNQNSNFEDLGSEGRLSDCGDIRSERCAVDMENPGQEFEQDFRRERRGPKMRRLGPDKRDMRGPSPKSSDLRHGTVRFPGSERRGPEMISSSLDSQGFEQSDFRDPDMRDGEPEQRGQTFSSERKVPHQAPSFQDPSDPYSVPFNRSLGPGLNRGGKSFTPLDNPQNQQPIRPPRHRGALLPTPTEGLIHFPNM